jgi:hypothetical protein
MSLAFLGACETAKGDDKLPDHDMQDFGVLLARIQFITLFGADIQTSRVGRAGSVNQAPANLKK